MYLYQRKSTLDEHPLYYIMKEIQELIHVVNKNKVKNIEVIGNRAAKKTLVQEFYEKLSDGSLRSDAEAAEYFYQSTPKDRKYKDLKRKLIERLHTTALFIDVNQARYEDASKAYYTCWKDIAAAKILEGKGAQFSAYRAMEKILSKAIRFGFNDIVIDLAKSLRLYYGSQQFDPKKFHHFDQVYKNFRAIYEAEALAEEYYSHCQLIYYGIKDKDLPAAYAQTMQQVEILAPLAEKYKGYRLNLLYFLIHHTALFYHGAYQAAINICEQAISFFKSNPDFPRAAQGIFMRKLFLLYWQEGAYQKGEVLLKEAVKYTREGDMSWFSNYGRFFLLCLHTQQYQRAYEIIVMIMNHPRFKSTPEWAQQRWAVYRAYIIYLGEMGKIEKVVSKKFRIQRFVNNVPEFSRDKRNQNIPILIIQILFLLLYKRYNEMIDRLEAIDKYCSRYLKKDDTFRSNCFIKMLLKIVEADFHPLAAKRKTTELRKKLEKVPFEATKQVLEVEVLPYEDLWDLALESLDRKDSPK